MIFLTNINYRKLGRELMKKIKPFVALMCLLVCVIVKADLLMTQSLARLKTNSVKEEVALSFIVRLVEDDKNGANKLDSPMFVGYYNFEKFTDSDETEIYRVIFSNLSSDSEDVLKCSIIDVKVKNVENSTSYKTTIHNIQTNKVCY